MKKVVFLISVFALAAIFFFRLNFTALESYDEAWYGEISRNLVQSGNPFRLMFNGSVFTDHPPLGFALMAVPTAMLGSNEFSVRFVSSLLGIGCALVIFFIGKELKNERVGFSAAVILLSSLWFMYRARSGNLDIPFVFWSLITFYALLKTKISLKYFYLATFAFAALFLTKTLVGVGILPVFLYTLWLRRRKTNTLFLVKLALCWIIAVAPWYLVNQLRDSTFLYHHFFEVGARGTKNAFALSSLYQSLFYLYVGMGKWLKVGVLTAPLFIFLWWRVKKIRETLLFIILFTVGFATPFLFSNKVEIWHLIPVYSGVALFIAYILETSANYLFPKKNFVPIFVTFCITLLAVYQFSQFANLLYPSQPRFSLEKDISIKASKYSHILLMGTFYPAAVYYADKPVGPLYWEENAYQKMVMKIAAQEGEVFIINKQFQSMLDKDQVQYEVLESNPNYLVVR